MGYEYHHWNICAELKVVSKLTGLKEVIQNFVFSYVNWTAERVTGND